MCEQPGSAYLAGTPAWSVSPTFRERLNFLDPAHDGRNLRVCGQKPLQGLAGPAARKTGIRQCGSCVLMGRTQPCPQLPEFDGKATGRRSRKSCEARCLCLNGRHGPAQLRCFVLHRKPLPWFPCTALRKHDELAGGAKECIAVCVGTHQTHKGPLGLFPRILCNLAQVQPAWTHTCQSQPVPPSFSPAHGSSACSQAERWHPGRKAACPAPAPSHDEAVA